MAPSEFPIGQVDWRPNLEALFRKVTSQPGQACLSDDILSLILCHVIAEPEARKLSARLLKRFRGIGATLAAKDALLLAECGGNVDCFMLLRSAHVFMQRALREPLDRPLILNTVSALFDYLRITMAHEESEIFKIIFLNSRNGIIAEETHSRGTVNHVPMYPREVVRRVLDMNAVAVILVHNHPTGDATPSQVDIDETITLEKTLNAIQVRLHDHVIVGKFGFESMRSLRILK